MRSRRLSCAWLLVWTVTTGTALAQESATEFWPEIDAWLRVSPAWRLSLFVPIPKNIETHYRDGNLIPNRQ